MSAKARIPLQFKFLLPTLVAAAAAFSWCLLIYERTSLQNHLRFVEDTNTDFLKSVVSELNGLFKLRFYELGTAAPKLIATKSGHSMAHSTSLDDPFFSLPTNLREEVLRISFYSPNRMGRFSERQIVNWALLKGRNLPEEVLAQPDKTLPLNLAALEQQHDLRVFNRSFRQADGSPLPVFSLVLFGTPIDGNPQETIIVADLLGDFVLPSLQRSERTDAFFLNKPGSVFAHSSAAVMADFANRPWPHPSVKALQTHLSSAGSFRWNANGRGYVASLGPSSLPEVFAVSETAAMDTAQVFTWLRHKTALAILAIWFALGWLVVFFASRISRNLRLLARVLDDFTAGRYQTTFKINSTDEVLEVAAAVDRLSQELPRQLETASRQGKSESDRATSIAVRSLLGSIPQLNQATVELTTHRPPDTLGQVDFWDSHFEGNWMTLIFGRTSDGGVSGALFAAYAKSCLVSLRTLNRQIGGEAPSMVQQAQMLNECLFQAYRGKHALLVTFLEINTLNGEIRVINAGAEGPFCLSPLPADKAGLERTSLNKDFSPVSPGLGVQPSTMFSPMARQLETGDLLFLYVHNRWRATSPQDAAQGRERLKQHLTRSFNPSAQAMKAAVIARNPFGDEMTFWILESKFAAIARAAA